MDSSSMTINAQNYKEFFANFYKSVNQIEIADNQTLQSAVTILKEQFSQRELGGDTLLQNNNILKIGIVGQVKAGKSSFLNSLFFDGENILPRASTPMTAGLTILKYGETNKFIVEYFNEDEWQYFVDKASEYDQIIKTEKAQSPELTDSDIEKMYNIDDVLKSAKEMVTKCGRAVLTNIQKKSKLVEKEFEKYNELQDILEEYVGANGKQTSIVKCITLELKDDRLKDIQIVDTPGVNDPVVSREMRTRQILQECHGVFFLSNSTSFFGSTDVSFLEDRIGSQGIGTVVLIASMIDAGLMDASGKYHDDLDNALSYVRTSLERQYHANIANANFNGQDPILDFNSSIGYSIAKKGPDRRDVMETHVVNRMRDLYPSYFASEEDIKEMFSAIANIEGEDGIRAKYLEGLFNENKARIIHSKLDAYFSSISGELSKCFENQKTVIINQLKAIQECENPEEIRSVMQNLLEQIRYNMLSILNRLDNKKEKAVKDTINDFSIIWDGNIPVTAKTVTCTRISTFWGSSKNFHATIDVIDKNKLAMNIIKLITSNISNLKTKWDKKSEVLRKFIGDSLTDFITQQEAQDSRIDGKMLRNTLEVILDEMSNEATMNISEIIHKVEADLPIALQSCDTISISFGKLEEERAKQKIKERAQGKKNETSGMIRDYIRTIYPEIEAIIKKAGEASTSCVIEKKDLFIDQISKKVNKSIDELEIQIKNRQHNIQILSSAINRINQIQNKL